MTALPGADDSELPTGCNRAGLVISRAQLEQWTGRRLSPSDLARLADALPESTVPEALACIAAAFAPAAPSDGKQAAVKYTLVYLNTDEFGQAVIIVEAGTPHEAMLAADAHFDAEAEENQENNDYHLAATFIGDLSDFLIPTDQPYVCRL